MTMERRRASAWVGAAAALIALSLQSCAPSANEKSATSSRAGAMAGAEGSRAAEGRLAVVADAGRVEFAREDWTFEDQTGQLLTSAGYRIYTTMRWPNYVEALPRFFETALDHYTTVITPLPRPNRPLDTFIVSNRPQWARLTQREMKEDAETYLRIQRGGFTANGRAILYFIGPHDTLAISAHESWHQYTQTVFRNQLPVWMEEGLACFMEGFKWNRGMEDRPRFLPWANTERFDALRTAVRAGKIVPLQKLTTQTPQELMGGDPADALTFYAQVWALIHFLNEGEGGKYRAALVSILSDASEGRIVSTIQRKMGSRAANVFSFQRRGSELLAAYATPDLERLEAEYEAFLSALVKVSARDRIVQGLSPLAGAAGGAGVGTGSATGN